MALYVARRKDKVTNIVSMRPILVEFVSAAGVGKSNWAAKIFDELDQRGVAVSNFQQIRIDETSIRNLLTVVGASIVVLGLKPQSMALFAQSAKLLAKFKIKQVSCKPAGRVFVYDEGFFQLLRGPYRISRPPSMTHIADKLIKYVRIPDVVVVVEATMETIIAKRSKRNRPNDDFDRESVARDVLLLEDTSSVIRYVQ